MEDSAGEGEFSNTQLYYAGVSTREVFLIWTMAHFDLPQMLRQTYSSAASAERFSRRHQSSKGRRAPLWMDIRCQMFCTNINSGKHSPFTDHLIPYHSYLPYAQHLQGFSHEPFTRSEYR